MGWVSVQGLSQRRVSAGTLRLTGARTFCVWQSTPCPLRAGIESVYRWQGDINVDKELLLIIKTKTALLQPLTSAVKELHPYDEPEVVAVPILGGSPSYLAWVADSTRAE